MTDNKIGLSTEKFLYYFMGLRKGDLRKQVETMTKASIVRGEYP